MSKSSWMALAGFSFYAGALAQTLTHGPFVSAVTDVSAKVYVRTDVPATVDIKVSADSLFAGAVIFSGATTAANDTSAAIPLTGLLADTKYFYKATIGVNDVSGVQYFLTFPAPGAAMTFHFAFGSCQSFDSVPPASEPIFDVISKNPPRFFLQCGDWGYPDTTDNVPTDSNFFAYDPQKIQLSYRAKYSGAQIKNLMAKTAFDYIYDDHDYVNDNASRTSSSSYGDGKPFREIGFLPEARRNSIDAYYRFFPHYDLPDTSEGIYHSFRFGNIEVFMCDDRSARSPNLEAISQQGDTMYFTPPPGHSVLGSKQLAWLLNGLKNSTATWKFVVTGVSFNKGYRNLINVISGNYALQQCMIGGQATGKAALGGIVDTWSGFPEEQDTILSFTQQNKIKNVIWLSSDSHTSAIDDGTNAGFPEIMAGNLVQTNSRLAFAMANASNPFISCGLINQDYNVWNAGGQGLGNGNFKDAYGLIDVYGNDSVKLCLVDVDDTVFASLTLMADTSAAGGIKRAGKLPSDVIRLFPNPNTHRLTVQAERGLGDEPSRIIIADAAGRTIMDTPSELHRTGEQTIDISSLGKGMYFLILRTGKGNFIKSFHKE